jgi:hypothetical protein
MALTKAQLKKIEEIISRRMLAFTYEATGDVALTDLEVEQLKAVGLLGTRARSFVGDPYLLGQVVALLPPSARASISFDGVARLAKTTAPLTAVETKAMEYAEAHAGEYIRGIATTALRDVRAATSAAGMSALRAVQDGVSQAIANRDTVSELQTTLFNLLDDASRDWRRVAATEINNAVQRGIYETIRAKSDDGEGQLVYKRPASDACRHCKRVYLMPDGVTPKIFKMAHLHDSNVGVKALNWGPTIGGVHPWCLCQLHVVPDGYDFVMKKVAAVDFEYEGRSYKRGQVLDDAVIRDIDNDNLMDNAILSHTGETGKPVEKSLYPSDDDQLACQC